MVISKIIKKSEIHPEKTAIIFNNEKITYKEFIKNVMYTKYKIESLSLNLNEPIGICLENSPEFLIVLLACELIRHPAVLLSHDFTKDEMEYHILNAGLRYIISIDNHTMIGELGGEKIRNIFLLSVYHLNHTNQKNIYCNGDFICQLTSGTNGMSKGVVRTSSSVELEIEETIPLLNANEEDCFLTIPPLYHSFGLIAGALLPLCIGCTLLLLPKFTTSNITKVMKEQVVTVLFAVPFMYKLLSESNYKEPQIFKTLKICVSAGAPLSENVLYKFYELSGVHIMQDYGSTETGVMAINTNPAEFISSVGKAVGSREFKIITSTKYREDRGILLTRSKCDLRRYLYPESANNNIIDGWINLGDIGHMDEDRNLYVIGRESNMINCGGLKVDPNEVEVVILEMSGVIEVVVVGQASKVYGEVVKAIIVSDGSITDKDIVNYCNDRLRKHKIPKIVSFVNEIPKSKTGKIQRKYLVNEGSMA